VSPSTSLGTGGEGASLAAWDPVRGCEPAAEAAIAAERSAAVRHVRAKIAHINATMGGGRIVLRGGVERVETEQAEHLCRVLGELANDLASGFHRGDAG
jgi:hypothetical protein